jgi:hypothetical protein
LARDLLQVSTILKKQLMLKRELAMTAVGRIMTGTEVAGCRSVEEEEIRRNYGDLFQTSSGYL